MQLKPKFERKMMKLSELKFDPDNPNVMNGRQQKGLKESFNKFGYIDEIVIDKKTKIVANGEHRLKELLSKGVTEAEIKLINFKNDAERRLFRQVFNKSGGEHEELKDALDMKIILEEIDMEDFANITSQSEQEVLNLLNKVSEESKAAAEKASQEMDVGLKRTVTCPKCNTEIEVTKK